MIENMVARDGIEPPTPAFSGPPTDAAKRLKTQRKRLIESQLHDFRFRTMWDDLGGFRLFDVRVLFGSAQPFASMKFVR
jgi:hypothetical protein